MSSATLVFVCVISCAMSTRYGVFCFDIANDHLSGKPGKVHEFDVVIENNANHEDDISLVVD